MLLMSSLGRYKKKKKIDVEQVHCNKVSYRILVLEMTRDGGPDSVGVGSDIKHMYGSVFKA